MRDYGKVYTAFWTSRDSRGLSEDGRALALYLMTCPHGNMLGCFRLPDGYAVEDLQWESQRVRKGFDELFAKGFSYRCEATDYVLIRHYLKWNQFENPNVGKAAGKLFAAIGAPAMLKAALAHALREYSPVFPARILTDFFDNSEPFDNPFELSSKTRTRARASTRASTEPQPEANPTVEQPLDEVRIIFEYWQKVMGSPRSVLDDKRRGLIQRALKGYSPADICKAIRGCSKSPHNMGVNEQKTKYNGLDLILRNADKIDRFIALDAGGAKAAAGAETIEETNRRIFAELMDDAADPGTPDPSIIEMDA